MMMSAPTLKEAVKQWEQKSGQKASQALEIRLNGILPPLEKLDTTLMTFVRCETLFLSTNNIERLNNFGSMKHLKVLSIGRNNIKSISGLEVLSETLEELWVSYNQIEKLKGIGILKKLRVLLISNNFIKDWVEFNRLSELPALRELGFIGNPLEERCTADGIWRSEVARRLPNITKLDGLHISVEQFTNPAAELNADRQTTEAAVQDPAANGTSPGENVKREKEIDSNNDKEKVSEGDEPVLERVHGEDSVTSCTEETAGQSTASEFKDTLS